MKDDFVVERCIEGGSCAEGNAVEQSVHIFEGADANLEPEPDFQRGIAGFFFGELDFFVVVDGQVNLGKGEIFFGIKIVDKIFVGKNLLTENDPLAHVNAAEGAWAEGASANDDSFGALIFEEDEIEVAKGDESFWSDEALMFDIGSSIGAKGQGFEGRLAMLINCAVGVLGGVELVNDIDRLGGHPELGHERVKVDDLLLFHSRLGDQVVELNAEHYLALGAEFHGQFLSHGSKVLVFIQGLPKKFAKLGVDCLGIIVAEESEG